MHTPLDRLAREQESLAWPIAPLPRIGGLATKTPLLMGVVNVTPDSFYDGGRYAAADAAIAHGLKLRDQGAHILDVGGESTRPGAGPVAESVELERVLPVIEALSAAGAVVSVDTRHPGVMTQATAAGAKLINDIAALTHPGAMEAAAQSGAAVILMHSNADPRTMQDAPNFDDVVLNVYDYLEARIDACEAAGISRENLIADPGIGFAKTPDHNADLLSALAMFHGLGVPLLLGISRKSFIGHFSDGEAAEDRLPGSLAAALWGTAQGAAILRVHDIAETRQALNIWQTCSGAAPERVPASS